MNASQRENFRQCLLEVAEANGSRFGLGGEAFRLFVGRFGFRVEVAEVERELDYLVDKGLLVEVPKMISPEVRAWRISASGRDLLARNEP